MKLCICQLFSTVLVFYDLHASEIAHVNMFHPFGRLDPVKSASMFCFKLSSLSFRSRTTCFRLDDDAIRSTYIHAGYNRHYDRLQRTNPLSFEPISLGLVMASFFRSDVFKNPSSGGKLLLCILFYHE